MENYQDKHIVIFDGVCNLCNGAVNFLIDIDKKNRLHFASLQSEFGQEILKAHNMQTQDFNTFIFLSHGQLFTRSTAALEVMKIVGGIWSSVAILKFVPRIIRDGVYKLISKYRYSIFGKREACRVPTPELKSKFL
ncbi:MAG: thiol-disulfide oxidoreductase DCC family protein [Thermoflexibacter sp.]|jgi:predicted DCC family thiol-disulfide oxidoreductase YuxK|nr:thiol-disulfide oxidoreductase DCC family protein [Thermoflexibacter sp.]